MGAMEGALADCRSAYRSGRSRSEGCSGACWHLRAGRISTAPINRLRAARWSGSGSCTAGGAIKAGTATSGPKQTTVNKVCGSGMQTVRDHGRRGASHSRHHRDMVVAGGIGEHDQMRPYLLEKGTGRARGFGQ